MLPLRFTNVFVDVYERISHSDVDAVDDMLDMLESEHAQPQMRTVIRVGDISLFATPRIHARSGLYRITWQYDDRRNPASILCITLAAVEIN